MKKKTKYTEGEIGDTKVIKDHLPSPKDLILKKGKLVPLDKVDEMLEQGWEIVKKKPTT